MNNTTVIGIIATLGAAGIFLFVGDDYLPLRLISTGMLIFSLIILAIRYFPELRELDIKKFLPQSPKHNLKIRGTNKERAYIRVQNAVNNRKISISLEDDGVYIRLSGNENEGEAFSDTKVKVYDYEK